MGKYLDNTGLTHLWTKLKAAFLGKSDPAYRTQSIFYGQVDGTSTSTAYTATIPGLTELRDGVCVMLKNGVVTSEAGFTINVNGLGAKPSYTNMAAATADTTIFNVNYTMLFVYDSARGENGGWICYRGYDANTNTIGYQLRTNSAVRTAADKGYRYRLWFRTLAGTYAPANTSTSTNATSSRSPNTRVIDPFGEIIYYSTNGTTNAGGGPLRDDVLDTVHSVPRIQLQHHRSGARAYLSCAGVRQMHSADGRRRENGRVCSGTPLDR